MVNVRAEKSPAAGSAIIVEPHFLLTGTYSALFRRKFCICSSFFKLSLYKDFPQGTNSHIKCNLASESECMVSQLQLCSVLQPVCDCHAISKEDKAVAHLEQPPP